MMKPILLVISLLSITFSVEQTEKTPFSINALQYLIDRKEYDRFDWFMSCYLKRHPDTADLHRINAQRLFDEAKTIRSLKTTVLYNRTGGIPRKYPSFLSAVKPYTTDAIAAQFNDSLLNEAFTALRYARTLSPGRKEIYWDLCTMAAQSGRSDILLQEVRRYAAPFGYSQKVKDLVYSYTQRIIKERADSNTIALLRNYISNNPADSKTHLLISDNFSFAGEVDSAFQYTLFALKHDSSNVALCRRAIKLATIRGDYAKASELARKCFQLSNNLSDLEQAAICSYAFDRFQGKIIYKEIKESPGYVDTLSISRWVFEDLLSLTNDSLGTHLFTGELFHLNFPLFYILYRQTSDQTSYFHNKAGAYYIHGLYDSAAYYNLKLIRTLKDNMAIGNKAIYNLAAEYYASGKYLLSFQLFLWIYHYFHGWQDLAVSYGLGVNYERLGDYLRAKKYYRSIIKKANVNNKESKTLKDLALYRIKYIKKLNPIIYTE